MDSIWRRIRNASTNFKANLHNIYIFPFLDVKARHLVQYLLNFPGSICVHYLFCSKSFILPLNFVFLQKELTLSFGVNYVFLRRRQVKVQKVRSWGWFTMLNPISKSFRQCLIQNDFANITMKCRICNNEEKCLLCCFDSGQLLFNFSEYLKDLFRWIESLIGFLMLRLILRTLDAHKNVFDNHTCAKW